MRHPHTPEPNAADLPAHTLVAEAGWSLVLDTTTDRLRPWCVLDWELPHGHRRVLADAFHDAVVARTAGLLEAVELLAAHLPPVDGPQAQRDVGVLGTATGTAREVPR
jgi:hypothetical protein